MNLRAQDKPVPRFADIAKDAAAARDSSDFDQAVALYKTGLTQRPSWVEGWWDLATIQYKLLHYSEARESFRRVTVLNPQSGAAFALMGFCDFEIGHYTSALKNLNEGGKLGSGAKPDLTPLILYHVALILTKQGDFELSMDQLAMFVASGNHSLETVVALGLNALRMQLVPSEIPQDKNDLVMKAGEAAWQFNAHNVEEAKRLYSALVTEYPDQPGVHYAFGMYLLDSDPSQALEEFNKELVIAPANNAARLQVAFFDLQQGAPEEAMKLARSVSVALPKDYRVHLVMGRGYLQTDQSPKAIQELKTSSLLAPEDSETHFYLAQAYRNLGNKEAAHQQQVEFDRLKQEKSRQTSAAGWWYFAGQYYGKRRFPEARDALRKVTDQNPKDGVAWGMMGLCDFELADYQNALDHLKKAEVNGLAGAPEMEASMHYYLAILFNREGLFDESLKELGAFIGKADDDPKIVDVLGLNTLRMKILPSEIPADQHDLVTQAGQAAWALNLGRLETARGLFEGLIHTYPSVPNLHYEYGMCLAQSSDFDGALREFQQELTISPNHVDAQSQMVFVYLKQGLHNKALQEARVAVKMGPDSFLPHNVMGWALLADHRVNPAIEEMAQSVRLSPDSPVAHFGLAQAYKAAGKTIEAQKELAIFQRLDSPSVADNNKRSSR